MFEAQIRMRRFCNTGQTTKLCCFQEGYCVISNTSWYYSQCGVCILSYLQTKDLSPLSYLWVFFVSFRRYLSSIILSKYNGMESTDQYLNGTMYWIWKSLLDAKLFFSLCVSIFEFHFFFVYLFLTSKDNQYKGHCIDFQTVGLNYFLVLFPGKHTNLPMWLLVLTGGMLLVVSCMDPLLPPSTFWGKKKTLLN